MGTAQTNEGAPLTATQLAKLRAELLHERGYHEGTLRYDVMTAALERIDAGTYGLCLDCQAAIPFERLEVMPETDRCIVCSPVH